MDMKDKTIFVTGVVGRAMGSGKFTGADIQALTDMAAQAFENTFGPVSAPEPQHQSAQPVQAQPQAAAGKEPGPAEGKPFQLWGNDKLKLGKSTESPLGKPWSEVTWAEAHQLCTGGSAKAAGYLAFLRDLALKGDKWDASNATIKARAAAVLASVGR